MNLENGKEARWEIRGRLKKGPSLHNGAEEVLLWFEDGHSSWSDVQPIYERLLLENPEYFIRVQSFEVEHRIHASVPSY